MVGGSVLVCRVADRLHPETRQELSHLADSRPVVALGPVTKLPVRAQPPVDQQQDALCPRRHHWIVGHQDDGGALGVQLGQDVEYLSRGARVQCPSRLIGEENLRLIGFARATSGLGIGRLL